MGKAGSSESRKIALKLITKKINLIQTLIRNHKEIKGMEELLSKNRKYSLQMQARTTPLTFSKVPQGYLQDSNS